jgi:hypothetical protein
MDGSPTDGSAWQLVGHVVLMGSEWLQWSARFDDSHVRFYSDATMAPPKKTEAEKEATRLATVARRKEQRAVARLANPPRLRGRPRKAEADSATVAQPKATKPAKSGWRAMSPRERRDYLRESMGDRGQTAIWKLVLPTKVKFQSIQKTSCRGICRTTNWQC